MALHEIGQSSQVGLEPVLFLCPSRAKSPRSSWSDTREDRSPSDTAASALARSVVGRVRSSIRPLIAAAVEVAVAKILQGQQDAFQRGRIQRVVPFRCRGRRGLRAHGEPPRDTGA